MGQGESLATSAHLRNRVPKGAFERLERHKWKHLRAVLRGLGGSNAPRLPGGCWVTGSPTAMLAEDDRILMRMKEIKAILFDLGNTLSRSASLSKSMVDIIGLPFIAKPNLQAHQLLKIGIEVEREIGKLYEVERLDQPDWQDVWRTGLKNCGFDFSEDEVEELCRTHLAQFVKNCEVEPYSIPLLESLRKAKIPLGLVSNVTGPSEIFEHDLSEKGLRPYFDAVVWSSRVGVRKPNPKIYQIILAELKQNPGEKILMIGDSESADILGGKRMGFTTVKIKAEGEGSSSVADYVVTGSELQSFLDVQFIWSKAS